MKLRRHLELNAWVSIGMVILMLALVVTDQVHDTFGWVAVGIMAPLFSYRAYRSFQRAKVTRDEERAHAPPTDATPDERRTYYKRMLWIAVIAFPIISANNIYDIHRLESGTVTSVTLDDFTAFVYEHWGAWPAYFETPLIGALVIGGMAYILKRNKEGRDLPRV